jgi:phage-related protein
MIASILNWISQFFQNLFTVSLNFIKDLFSSLFNGLIEALKAIFMPVLVLIAFIFYFIYKLGELLIVLFQVLLSVGKLIYSFVMGLFKTLAGFVWTPMTPSHGSWSEPIREVFAALEPYQLNKIAYVLMFVIWIFTAVGVVKILSGRGIEG